MSNETYLDESQKEHDKMITTHTHIKGANQDYDLEEIPDNLMVSTRNIVPYNREIGKRDVIVAAERIKKFLKNRKKRRS